MSLGPARSRIAASFSLMSVRNTHRALPTYLQRAIASCEKPCSPTKDWRVTLDGNGLWQDITVVCFISLSDSETGALSSYLVRYFTLYTRPDRGGGGKRNGSSLMSGSSLPACLGCQLKQQSRSHAHKPM